MKKLSITLALLFLFVGHTFAQNRTETVRFARGSSDAMLTRTLNAKGSQTFVINARKDQTMSITVGYDFDDNDVKGFLTEPGSQDISMTLPAKEPKEFIIKRTGNHKITVNNNTRKRVTFTLYLTIE